MGLGFGCGGGREQGGAGSAREEKEEDDEEEESIADLAGKEDVLAGLGHGAVRGIHDKDPAVHLRSKPHHQSDEYRVPVGTC